MSKEKFDQNELSDEQRKLVEKLRAAWQSAVTQTFVVGFTISDTSVDLACIPDMLVYPRRDGIYVVEVGKEGLEMLQAMEEGGRIKALEKNHPAFNRPNGFITPVVFIVRSHKVDVSAVPGLKIRLNSGDAQVRCGEVVGDEGMEVLRKLQQEGQISLPN
jgi:hypothetical protein